MEKFLDYPTIWWDQLVDMPIEMCEEMNRVMRKRFVSNHYYLELFKKFQGLRQGTKTVEDYHKDMKVIMIRENNEKDDEATMA